MLTLSTNISHHAEDTAKALRAAEGYVYLGLYKEGLKELDQLHESEQEERDVLIARVRILLHMERWIRAARLSAKAGCLYHEEDEFTVQRAFALHKMRKTEEAARVLLEAPDWIRRTGILHYNLACYQARWGNLQVARQCVQTAIKLNSAIKKNARQDPDLAELWN